MSRAFPEIPDLAHELRQLLKQIPRGRVTTYGRLAEALGNRAAARWVAHHIYHQERDPACPTYRVIAATGELGLCAAMTPHEKASRLEAEGVEVVDNRIDLQRFAFAEFQSQRPLEKLREVQESVASRVVLRAWHHTPELVGGVDVSYPAENEAVAAYTLVDVASGGLVWSTTIRRPVIFPYIVTYLTFREVPFYVELLQEVRAAGKLAEVLLVDGSGILHQRHVGSASHLGVVAGIPTVGVTKTLLVGQVDLEGMASGESRSVVQDGRAIGAALRPTGRSRRPIFISPGHLVDLPFSEGLVRRLLRGRRLPEPLYWADRLSRAAGKGQSGHALG
jgi:deoxyribonuclease V